MMYNPVTALVIFFVINLGLFLVFRPKNGVYFRVKRYYKQKDKVVIEDILKYIYNQNTNNSVTINDLTNALKFSNTVLIDCINVMIDRNLLFLEKGIYKLTSKGHNYALQIVRAHRLWEKYLSEKTGFHKEEWHERAEEKEHELDIDELNRLSKLLGNPKFDPHGDPIPTQKGRIATTKGVPLTSLKVGTIGKISHIEDKPDIIYKQILAKNIYIYSIIQIIENNDNKIVFYSENERFELSTVIAGNITVVLLENDEFGEKNSARLSNLQQYEQAIIVGLSKECRGENRRRLLDLGFVKGATIQIDLLNPLGDPKAYLIKGTSIAIRKNQASKILIKKIDNAKN